MKMPKPPVLLIKDIERIPMVEGSVEDYAQVVAEAQRDKDAAYYESIIQEIDTRHQQILRQAMSDVRRVAVKEMQKGVIDA